MNQNEIFDLTLDRLKREGYKITLARRAVIEALVCAPSHRTAPQLVTAVAAIEPTVGRASVYRTLDLLSELGLVQLSNLGGATASYLLSAGGHLHHVVCRTCRKTVSFEECTVEELERDLAQRFGFQIEGHLIELYGRCEDCQNLTN